MICATCRNWSLRETPKEMAKLAWANCAIGKKWTFYPPTGTCERHTKADAEMTAKRIEWLKSKGFEC